MNRRFWMGLALCCCAATICFSENSAALLANHDCCGEGCPVCFLAQEGANCFRQLKYIPVFPAFPGVLISAAIRAQFSVSYGAPVSAVGLKVKMNR
jgi:hypothetical protein